MEDLADPRDSSLIASLLVRTIRRKRGGSLEEVARYLGFSEKTLRRWEQGACGASPKNLDLLAKEAGYTPALIHGVVRLLGLLRLAEAGPSAESSPSLTRPFSEEVLAVVATAAREAYELLAVEPAPEPWERGAGIPAEVLWRRFTGRDRVQQKRLVCESAVFHNRSFCERLCAESVAVAPDSPAEALELAELAVDVARKVPGSASQRAAAEAYALGHLGNARRVCTDLAEADAEFGRMRQLLAACGPNDLSLAARSRLLDLEASLRRAQRRFPEAHVLLEQALALGITGTKGRLLIKKACTFQQMHSYKEALATLAEAKPIVEAHGTLRELYALRFNTAVNYCHLSQAEKAATLLPEIRTLTEQLNKATDRLKTRWLETRIDAGLGRTEKAIAGIDRVCEEFLHTDPPLPYDAALAGLDLALYWLQDGNTAAVQRLAPSLERIFRAKGIRREALASLRLFCDAARREAATLELRERPGRTWSGRGGGRGALRGSALSS